MAPFTPALVPKMLPFRVSKAGGFIFVPLSVRLVGTLLACAGWGYWTREASAKRGTLGCLCCQGLFERFFLTEFYDERN